MCFPHHYRRHNSCGYSSPYLNNGFLSTDKKKLYLDLLPCPYSIHKPKHTTMKRLLFAVAAMAFLVSCETKDSGSAANNDHAAAADHNAEGTKKVYHALETGDVSALDSLFTEDVVDHNGGPQGQDVRGRDSVKAMIGQIHNYFDGLKMELLHHATSTDGKYHYATVRMTGKAKANPWGMREGMDVDDTSVDVIRMENGKCAEHWGFMSMQDMNEMMAGMKGAMPPPPKDAKK
jgi:ketosteroid isomerase-like protein